MVKHCTAVQRSKLSRHQLERPPKILLKEKKKLQYDVCIIYVQSNSHIHVFVHRDMKSRLEGCTPNSYLEKRRGDKFEGDAY